MMFWPQQRVGPAAVVLGRQAEHRRIGRRLGGELGGHRPLVAHDGDELGHAGPEAAALVRLVDRLGDRQRALAIGQDRGERRLVRDERPDVLGVLRHEGERVDRAAAAGEQVDRARVERGDDPMQVVGVLLGRGRAGRIGLRAALDAPRVVGHHGAIGEVARERHEPAGAHRRSDENSAGAEPGPFADVVGQGRARRVQGVRGRLGHRGHRASPAGHCA